MIQRKVKTITRFISILTLVVLFDACTYIYYPSYPVIPDTKSKGFGMQAAVGLQKAQVSAWYALDSNWFATASYVGAKSLMGDGDSIENKRFGTKSFLGSVGYRIPIENKAELHLQIGGGYTYGFLKTLAFTPETSSQVEGYVLNTTSSRLFIQPTVKINRGKGGFYITPRFTYESFNSMVPKYVSEVQIKRNYMIGELFIMGRFVTKIVNIDLYAGVAGRLNHNENESNNFWIVQPGVLGFGLSRTFN